VSHRVGCQCLRSSIWAVGICAVGMGAPLVRAPMATVRDPCRTMDLPEVIAKSDGETRPWPQMRPRKRVERFPARADPGCRAAVDGIRPASDRSGGSIIGRMRWLLSAVPGMASAARTARTSATIARQAIAKRSAERGLSAAAVGVRKIRKRRGRKRKGAGGALPGQAGTVFPTNGQAPSG